MKMPPRLLAAALLLSLGACVLPAEYTESEARNELMLDNASARVSVRFAPGSNRLVAGDAARLRAMAASGVLAQTDRVTVAAAGTPELAALRFRTIADELLRYRIVASPRQLVSTVRDHAVVESERVLVTLPRCPNWSKQASLDLTNTLPSNYGCANTVNLGQSVAYPADLVEGRPVAMAEGQPAAAAVNRYLRDQVRLPTAAAVGPIATPTSPTPAAPGAGAGGTGSQ